MYPRLVINLAKIKHNTEYLVNLLGSNGISVAAVTKVFCADQKIVETILDCGVKYLADSRLENIESYPKHKVETMLLRLPSPKEAKRVVEGCDISLVSEIKTINALAKAADEQNKLHGVILMVDLGDLREGVYYRNEELLLQTAKTIHSKKSLKFCGIGTNLTCYGSVLPTLKNMQLLLETVKKIEVNLHVKLPVISGGNSSSLHLFYGSQNQQNSTMNGNISSTVKNEMSYGVTNLRLGESIVRGHETAYGKPFEGLETDAVILEAEIIEIMEKPSYPEGEIGINAFGEKIHYDDIGIRKRAILAVGRQDIDHEGLHCLEPNINIIGASSDHLLVDVASSNKEFNVGDILVFSLSYGSILSGFTSKYVKRNYV